MIASSGCRVEQSSVVRYEDLIKNKILYRDDRLGLEHLLGIHPGRNAALKSP
jgi:hypothetical protein